MRSPRSRGVELDEDDVTALFEARGARPRRRARRRRRLAPRGLRRHRHVRRHAERQLHERLLLPLRLLRVLEGEARSEPARAAVRRPARRDRPPCREAWDRGAVEICLQGGIHPAFTGDTYVGDLRGGEAGAARSPRPRVLGARGLAGRGDARPAARRLPRAAARPSASPPSRARRPRSSTTRSGACSARTR